MSNSNNIRSKISGTLQRLKESTKAYSVKTPSNSNPYKMDPDKKKMLNKKGMTTRDGSVMGDIKPSKSNAKPKKTHAKDTDKMTKGKGNEKKTGKATKTAKMKAESTIPSRLARIAGIAEFIRPGFDDSNLVEEEVSLDALTLELAGVNKIYPGLDEDESDLDEDLVESFRGIKLR